MKIVYDPRHLELLPNGSLMFSASTLSSSLDIDFITVFDSLPTEPFYYLLDINYVADYPGGTEIVIDLESSDSLKALQQFPIPEHVLDRVLSGSALILLSRPYHGYPVEVLDKLLTIIIEQVKPIVLDRSQFVFMLPASGKKFVPYLNIIDFTFFERMVGEHRHPDNKSRIWNHRHRALDTLTAPPGRFICTNRRSNVYRLACTVGLWDLRDRGLMTLLQHPDDLPIGHESIGEILKSHFPELEHTYIDKVKDNLPLTWDVGFGADLTAETYITPDGNEFLTAMLDSALCIVNETLMADQPPQWHSEKTYKAISLMMPFIVIGQRHTLAALRAQGYQTFSPAINESYDDIEDRQDRLRAAVAEARRIIEMDNSDIVALLKELQPALEHNFQYFYQRYDNFDDDALSKLKTVLDKWTVDNR